MKNRALVLGAATNWAAFAATMGVSFFLAPYYICTLGDARYGIWSIVESILAYFTLLDLGIAVCLVRFVARNHAAADRVTLNRLVNACLAVFCVAAAAVIGLGSLLVPFTAPALERQAGFPGDVAPFMLLMLANLALTLPLSVFPTILDGLQRFGVKSAIRLAFLAVRVVGIVLMMENQQGLLGLAIVFTATNLLEHAAMGVMCFKLLPELKLGWRFVDRAGLREVKGSSVHAFLAMLAGRVTVQTGAIIIGGFLNAAAAAHYAIASRLVELAKNLLRSITTTLTPAVSEREAKGDHDGVRQVLLDGTRLVLYLVLPIHIGLLVFGKPFLERWIGKPEYAAWCYPTLAILSATLTLGVAQSVASRILYGLGRLRLFARLAIVEAVLNLAMSLALVTPFGLEGVAAAVAIPNVLFSIAVIVLACRNLGVSTWAYLIRGWFKPLAACTVPALVWLLNGPVEATWIGIGLGIAIGLVPYAVVVFVVEVLPLIRRSRASREVGEVRSWHRLIRVRPARSPAPSAPRV